MWTSVSPWLEAQIQETIGRSVQVDPLKLTL